MGRSPITAHMKEFRGWNIPAWAVFLYTLLLSLDRPLTDATASEQRRWPIILDRRDMDSSGKSPLTPSLLVPTESRDLTVAQSKYGYHPRVAGQGLPFEEGLAIVQS